MRRGKLFMAVGGLVLAGLLAGCNGIQPREDAAAQAAHKSLFQQQMPVEPLKWPYVNVYDAATNKFITVYWASLKPEKKKLDLLPLHLDNISVFTEAADGSLSFAPLSINAKGSTYLLLFDFIKGDVEQVCDKSKKPIATANIGIGVRVKARITSKAAGFSIASLGDLSAAAKAEKVEGQLFIQTIGIDSQSVSDLMPYTSEVSQSSVQAVMQSLAAIKSKMWDNATTVTPYLVSVAAPEGLSWSDLAFCGDAPASISGVEKITGIKAPMTLMLGPFNQIN